MTKISVIILSAVILLFTCGMSEAEKPLTPSVDVRLTEVIIKVDDGVITMPEGVYKAPIGDIEIGSAGLKELNKKFNLVSIEKMYAGKTKGDTGGSSGLENTYLLKFPEHIDTGLLVAEYEGVDGVIYAEENKVMTIF